MMMMTMMGGGWLVTTIKTVKEAMSRFVDEDKLAEVERFFRERPAAPAKRTLEQSLENARTRVAWLKRCQDEVLAWLTDNGF